MNKIRRYIMKVKLTESNKHFIDTLCEEDRAKVIVTDDTIESSDESMHDKLMAYHKAKLAEMAEEIRAFNKQLKAEHPEYFE
jgi:hypothetical protein